MSKINIQFPDSSIKSYNKRTSCFEIVKSISNSLSKKVLVASFNDKLIDLSTKLNEDGLIKFYTWDDDEGKFTFWHSSAHILAESVENIYPGVKFGIGPPIANGFYYDIDFGKVDVPNIDLSKLEDKFKELCSINSEFKRSEVSKKDALKYFTKKKDKYKLELIDELEDGEISFYEQGKFVDLCKGPHIPSTKYIKSVKILNVAGAYWRGDEKNNQLTRL